MEKKVMNKRIYGIKIKWIIVGLLCLFPKITYGQVYFLSQEEIGEKWGGIEEKWNKDFTVAYVKEVLSKDLYEEWFPNAYGSESWCRSKGISQSPGEYYSYDNFIEAVGSMSELKYKKLYRQGYPSCAVYYRLHKPTGKQTLIYEDPSFNNIWNRNKPIEEEIIDLGSFLNGPSKEDNLRELSAFFAHVAHETQDMYYKEEIAYTNRPTKAYTQRGTAYDGIKGTSYHGRGPLQISWNYNYGLISSLIYGDPKILLEEPEQVSEKGKVGYMSAIAYWMLPQGSKPSCHQVMQKEWKPNQKHKNLGMKEASFGVTINIIHGKAESNKTIRTDKRVRNRVEHYIDFTKGFHIDVSKEQKDTWGMKSFR